MSTALKNAVQMSGVDFTVNMTAKVKKKLCLYIETIIEEKKHIDNEDVLQSVKELIEEGKLQEMKVLVKFTK